MKKLKLLFFAIICCLAILPKLSLAQKNAIIFGKISDSTGQHIADVNIQVRNENILSSSNEDGSYQIQVPAEKELELIFTYVGRNPFYIKVAPIGSGERKYIPIQLSYGISLKTFVIAEERDREKISMVSIDPKKIEALPNVSGSFESILKTLPGVTSNSELSSQYNVRGGNYDENLIYVNDIEIYRPFLPRSGQQEGLSFIHTELVQNVKFSAGGFEARYGDKLSSVLDIKYKDPTKFASSVNAGLLGVQSHIEGASKNLRFTYLLGARYWSNKYVLGTLDVQGDYQPSFYDVQTLLNFHPKENLSISVLGSFAQNRYNFIPQNRETTFGTVNRAYRLNIYFDGADLMEYQTGTLAATINYKPSPFTQLKLIASTFYSNENEIFTVEGAYRLSDIETDLGSDNFAQARNLRGIGYFINNARNAVIAQVSNIGHRGYHTIGKNNVQWGAFFQTEHIQDKLHEWQYDDSSGFSRPQLDSNGNFVLNNFLSTRLNLSSYRLHGYIQNSQTINKTYNAILTYGLRANYWSYNQQLVFSPRFQFGFEPNRKHNRLVKDKVIEGKIKKDWMIKAAYGWYYQPPFYRELRDFDGVLNPTIKAQRAIHYVVGGDMNFVAWNRPFKFMTEVYYKQLDNLIPYEIDNVRIRYFANNNSSGYASGIDFRVNGEFVKGAESWASVSFMKTQEKITGVKDVFGNDIKPSYIARPTDQRFTFAIYFQDYLRNNPKIRMNLNLVYGSGLPFGVPDRNRYNDNNRMPSYRRVDIGLNRVLISEDTKTRDTFWRRRFKSAWVGIEIFNLLGINNTISYIWIEDVSANRYAVPNYLTNRRINLRLLLKF
ncbi:MAG: TonB-dependent receptor [Sphingobacteriales bacterium]|nr:TonB-dependent receptor [Sphingobacteriales bacterium]